MCKYLPICVIWFIVCFLGYFWLFTIWIYLSPLVDSFIIILFISFLFYFRFTLDDQGLPRRWGKHDDVAAIFTKARKNAEVLLEKFAFLRLDPKDDDFVYFSKKDEVFIHLFISQFIWSFFLWSYFIRLFLFLFFICSRRII